MTAAQRLRLVLALGVVNVILATVALSVGISGLSTEPSTGDRPSPGIAVVSPSPTATPGVSNPTPTATQPTSTPTPGGQGPSPGPSVEPAPTTEPSVTPSTEPSAVPIASPVAPPTRGPTLIASPATPVPATGPAPAPAATPVPTPAPTPGKASVRAPDRPDCPIQATEASRATDAGEHRPAMTGSKGRACGHDKDVRPKTDKPKADKPKSDKSDKSAKPAKDKAKHQHKASKADDHGKDRLPATVEKPRREPKNAHRLRTGRRAR